ncbi:MAG: globin domain-containing protein [Candidatus Hodarchaeales archaeon]|jgi:hemoglobin-like flavoprotein
MTLKIQSEISLNDQEALEFLESIEQINNKLDLLSERFYHHFFRQDSSIRELFENIDKLNQQKMFQDSLDSIIRSFKSPDFLYTHLIGLATRHSNYGVKYEHLRYFREAFLASLADILTNGFTKEIYLIWNKVIDFILNVFYKMM